MQGNEIEEEVTEMKAWQDKIRSVVPYTPGEQPNRPNMIKLNTNENPYPPAPGVRKVLDTLDEDKLRLYPDPTAGVLVNALADYYHVGTDQVFTGVGSDDVLAIAFMTFFNSDKPIFFPDITYSFYPVWADLFKVPYETKPLKEDFSICPQDYYPDNGGVIFPNAPTSHYEDLSVIREILNHNQDVIVIVDEAYIDFAGESALSLLDDYENLLIVQTFSKSRSMAGMRIGYAIGHPDLIKAMNDVRFSYNSYPMTRLSVALGVAAIEDEDYFQATKNQIIETREWTKRELKALGFTFGDSKTNFIFAKHSTVDAEVIFDKLREKHIFVRHFSGERIRNYLRISIGTMAEMEKFIDELKKIV